ncbi:MAG: hypothetical protein ACJ788_18025 [Ktedonobacteraceae bacterium]
MYRAFHIGIFTDGQQGSPNRKQLRDQIFYENVFEHWQDAVREPQNLRYAKRRIIIPRARTGEDYEAGWHG